MLEVTEAFQNAFKNLEREIDINLWINKVLFKKSSIKKLSFSSGAMSGNNFQIGSAQAATLKVSLSEVVEGIKELDQIDVEIGIKIPGSGMSTDINNVSKVGRARIGKAHIITFTPDRFEYVPLGTFFVSGKVDPDRNENTTTIEAIDGFIFMEGSYESKLSYPTKISEVALEIANLSGSVIDPISFNHLSNYKISKPEGCTYRQAIALIAQYEAGFACFDRMGRLSIRELSDPNFRIEPSEYFLKGLTKSEVLYTLGGISCKVTKKKDENNTVTTVLHSGKTSGSQIELENNTMTQLGLNSIYEKIKTTNFYPISIKWRGNPALEVGDWVTMVDRSGKKFKAPILSYSLEFDGGITSVLSADTKTTSQDVAAFKGPLQQKLDDLDYRVDAAGKNNVYDGTEEPKHPKEGDIWFKPNGPDTEIWVYTKVADNIFKWILQVSTALDDDVKQKIDDSTPSDEIIKTINLSDEMDGKEWLKITGAKLWLTGETKIDDAIITSAMIASIQADKIKTGILDAAHIRVVNMDASAISTGTLNAINIHGSSITGSEVNGGKIIAENSTFRMTMSNGRFTWTRLKDNLEATSITADTYNNKPYLIFDGSNGQTNGVFFRGKKGSGTNYFDNDMLLLFDYGASNSGSSFSLHTNDFWLQGGDCLKNKKQSGLIMYKKDENQIQFEVSDPSKTVLAWLRNGEFSIALGNFRVSGSKNSIVQTQDYGQRLLNAYETPEYLFADYGKVITDNEGIAKVEINKMFLQTINTHSKEYHVFLSPYGDCHAWTVSLKKDSFIIRTSEPNIKVSYQLVAYRLGYEEHYLETCESDDEKKAPYLTLPINENDSDERYPVQIKNYVSD